MDFYDLTVPQLIRTLRNLDRWIDLAAKHAEDKQLSADKILNARLAPDQYMFVKQVQVASDNGKLIPGRLSGKDWPSHPDTETTFEQLRARLTSVTQYLETFEPADFAEAATRKIVLPWMKPGQYMHGGEYLVQFALPNFYFHVMTAYSILRHEGVQLGKSDYLGEISIRE